MAELFDSGSIKGMPILEFLKWVEQSVRRIANKSFEAPPYGVLALPPVQRTPVWRPKQIVDLWDSVLRGLPIGSLYLVKRGNHEKARGLAAESRTAKVGEGWGPT